MANEFSGLDPDHCFLRGHVLSMDSELMTMRLAVFAITLVVMCIAGIILVLVHR